MSIGVQKVQVTSHMPPIEQPTDRSVQYCGAFIGCTIAMYLLSLVNFSVFFQIPNLSIHTIVCVLIEANREAFCVL